MCYWFFRLNVCAAVAFLLFNTSRESFEKTKFTLQRLTIRRGDVYLNAHKYDRRALVAKVPLSNYEKDRPNDDRQ